MAKPARKARPTPRIETVSGRTPGTSPKADAAPARLPSAWWPVLLVVLVLAAFLPAVGNGFVDLDDEDTLLRNPHVQGLGPDQVRWAFSTFLLGTYQPLGWLAYQAQYAAWKLDPKGYHLTSLLLHAATVLALFGLTVTLLRRAMPATFARHPRAAAGLTALAVGLFAGHPLRAEVVAWATCQTYLPCALCTLLSVLAYLRACGAEGRSRVAWQAGSIGLFAAALASHPVPLGLPLVLLALDVYPLRRLGPEPRRVLAEKVPYLLVSLAFAVLAFRARMGDAGVTSLAEVGLGARVAQACYSACFYPIKTVLPLGLRAVYPPPAHVGWTEPEFALSILAVAAVSLAAFCLRRRRPGLAVAWVSYLALLAPNSGLVQNIAVLTADRYSYLSMMAWTVLLASWLCGLVEGPARRPRLASGTVALALGLLVAAAWATRGQCRTWRDSASVWQHALAQQGRPDPYLLSRLGRALGALGDSDRAEARLTEALRVAPGSAIAHNKLGLVLVERGRLEEAQSHFAEAVRLEPTYVEGQINLGYALVERGQLDEAEAHFAEAVRLAPELVEARGNLGAVLTQRGKLDEAARQFAEVLRLEPGNVEARKNLGYVLARQGKPDEAIRQYAVILKNDPGHAEARQAVQELLARTGRPAPIDLQTILR